MQKEIKVKGPFVIDIYEVETWNDVLLEEDREHPFIERTEKLKFKNWEDAIRFLYFKPYIRRDAYAGMFETKDEVVRYEFDEGGSVSFALHKWDGFEDCRKQEFIIKHGTEEWTVHSNEEKDKVLEGLVGEGASIYWKDGWVDHYGWACDKDDNVYDNIFIEHHENWQFSDKYKERFESNGVKSAEPDDETPPVKRIPAPIDEREEEFPI